MVGISIPSKKNLFSDGDPPLTIISFRKPIDVATPGKFATTFEISLFPPALLEISEASFFLAVFKFQLRRESSGKLDYFAV